MFAPRNCAQAGSARIASALLVGAACLGAPAATLTVQTNIPGPTPDVLGYNAAHFFTGSNTKEWWRYSRVSGARMFINPADIEPSDDIAGRGDGVTNQSTFLSRKAALRANPTNTAYINWPVFTNNYQNADLASGGGANHICVNFALARLRELGVQVLAQITASESALVISNAADWAGKWELWQHYYAQAFYLARNFEVRRFQMFNEPDIGTITTTNWLMRLQLSSDAIQSALADVNALYGKSLTPLILAPVTAGSTSAYTGWGDLAVSNRHVDFLGATDTNFLALNRYDFHRYSSTPSSYGDALTNFAALLTADMAPEPRFPLTVSEFNTRTGANFDTATNASLDSPDEYSNLGAIAVSLATNGANELYCFKFGQTERAGSNAPVAKNGMHYVNNTNSPYNTGGVTKAGEVWRLVNKALAPGRSRISYSGSGVSALDQVASYDPAARRYYIFSANTGGSLTYTVDVAAWGLPVENRMLIEEVSESRHGGGRTWGSISSSNTVFDGTDSSLAQPGNTVWLFTIPAPPQQAEQILNATEDAHVRDGASNAVNFGPATRLLVRNDPTNRANRAVTFIKFRLPPVHPPDIQLAVLSLRASATFTSAPVQAHVYGLLTSAWSQAAINWINAPNLRDNVSSTAPVITNNWIESFGTNVQLLGQLVVASTNKSERLIDVTDFLRGRTNSDVTFMISQDPRWDVAIPAITPGDPQPDGIEIVSSEGATTNTPGPQLRFVRLKDTDGDGLSDEAEGNTFGTNPIVADTDGDGVNDGLEVLVAGTNPGDANSFLKVTAVSRPGSGLRLDWPSVSGKIYRLLRATNFSPPDWQLVTTVTGTGALMNYTDPLTDAQAIGAARVFYRLEMD